MSSDRNVNILVLSRGPDLARRVGELGLGGSGEVAWDSDTGRALEKMERKTWSLLITTSRIFRTGNGGAVEFLGKLGKTSPGTKIVYLTDPAEMENSMEAIKAGNCHYAKLPVSDPELVFLVDSALREPVSEAPPKAARRRKEPGQKSFHELIGSSTAMKEIYRQIRQAAATDIPVMIQGETGTGKELTARAIHAESDRREEKFIPVNLGAMPRELVGSELFGHEKGSFTGATDSREGKFELGDNGTVFLDEIGTIEEKVQVSLLRLIEHKQFYRLGGKSKISTNARLITATNDNLAGLVRQGEFREDLYYRLDVFRIDLPPLRLRENDLELLAGEFLRRFNESLGKEISGLSSECLARLESYRWPGNIRELKNVIQRAVLVSDGPEITLEDLPPRFSSIDSDEAPATMSTAAQEDRNLVVVPVGATMKEVEHKMILKTLQATRNNRKKAAEMLGISRRSFYNKLNKYNID